MMSSSTAKVGGDDDGPPPYVIGGADVSSVFGSAADVKSQVEIKYLGSRPIHFREGVSEQEEAVSAAETIKKGCKTPTKAVLIVSPFVCGVVNAKDGVVHQHAPLEYTVQHFAHPKNKKMLIYVTRNARLGVAYCHVVTGTASQVSTLASTIQQGKEGIRANLAQSKSQSESQSGADAPKMSDRAKPSKMESNLAELEAYDDSVHGVFEGRYLGSVPVGSSEGQNTVVGAYAQAQKNLKKAREPGRESIIIVTTDGLRVFEALTEDQMMVLDLLGVTFAASFAGDDGDVLALIETDSRLDQKNCFLWTCTEPGMGKAAQKAISASIELVKKRTEAKADDPFYPDSFKKESVPPALEGLQIDRNHLTGVKVLGAGQFGRVYLAVQSYGEDEAKDVQRAVKLLREGASASDKEEFTREAEIMTLLDHENIVKIVGAAMVYRPWLVVLEMMQYGDLKKVMLACQSKNMKVTFLEILLVAEQVAAALEYCAAKGFVHMDVAARNALLHTNNLVKLSDFGITRPVDPDTGKFRLTGQLRMAVRWMPPETLGKHPILFSEKTDVYSFGVFLWELPSYGRLPFRTLKAREAKDKIKEGLMLGPPPECPDALYEIMLGCWKRNPDDRFSFHALRQRLQGLIERERPTADKPRDIGAEINQLLTSDFQRASRRATQKRRASRKGKSPSADVG
eukprot:m.941208 g.941208  ORF g.941208 m.941208 type:complete len:683 (+) comp23832_c0_seq7:176-2224(+)